LINKIYAEIELAIEPGKSESSEAVLISIMHIIKEAQGK